MAEKIHKGISYTVVSQVVSMGLQFGLSVILARGLGSDAYGLYGVVQNAILTVSSVLDMGGNSAVTKFIANSDAETDGQKSTNILASTLALHTLLTGVFWLILFVFAGNIVRIWFDGDYLLYVLFALSVPILIFINDLIGTLYGLRELKFVALRMIAQNVLITALNVLFIWRLKMGVQAAASIYSLVLLVMFILLVRLFVPIFRDGRLVPRYKLQIRKILLFSLPIGGLNILDTVIRYAPVLLTKALGVNDPSVNQKVASLSLAILLGGVAEGVLMIVVKSGFGYVGRWLFQGKHKFVLTYIFLMLATIIASYAAILLITLIGIKFFINFTYGSEYQAINLYIIFTLLVSMIRSITVLFRTVLYAMDLFTKAFLASVVEFSLYVTSVLVLNFFETNVDWGVRLLQIALLVGCIKASILFVNTFSSFRQLETAPIPQTILEGLQELWSGISWRRTPLGRFIR